MQSITIDSVEYHVESDKIKKGIQVWKKLNLYCSSWKESQTILKKCCELDDSDRVKKQRHSNLSNEKSKTKKTKRFTVDLNDPKTHEPYVPEEIHKNRVFDGGWVWDPIIYYSPSFEYTRIQMNESEGLNQIQHLLSSISSYDIQNNIPQEKPTDVFSR